MTVTVSVGECQSQHAESFAGMAKRASKILFTRSDVWPYLPTPSTSLSDFSKPSLDSSATPLVVSLSVQYRSNFPLTAEQLHVKSDFTLIESKNIASCWMEDTQRPHSCQITRKR